ncbi:nucleotidyl transferase AbiEii/AbiGii toxin family protein [Teredinibacter haidensis]|uniref:nucleotidyl transferase AbiEii/AbiGii toxin family protein n=1 Tax=Teredinibacter haidensis TaxID=2731755 RepID=UPI0009490D68|nr:nucleotidyl transferase AbiEii/AbiGii toxin family protein [Teredinibacter haidensis]
MKDIAKSIKGRLLNTAKAQNVNFNTLLAQYALQRLLYRLSISVFKDQFLLKRAWLFVVWNNTLHRATRDLDLLGFGDNTQENRLATFKILAALDVVPENGFVFELDSFGAEQIKKEGDYQGVRIQGKASLDSAIIPIQVGWDRPTWRWQ